MYKIIFSTLMVVTITLSGCAINKGANTANEREMTLGLVQKEIRAGMSQADVAEALGSPNIVTKDSSGRETWIYDKIATEASYSRKERFWTLILYGGSNDSGKYNVTQRTLTAVIKFDDKNLVGHVSYHSSKF